MRMNKPKTKKSKRDTLIQGFGIAFLVFVLCLFILNAWMQPKFQKAYDRGYEQGQKDCKLLVFNTSSQPDGVHHDFIDINFSLNLST